MPCSLKEVTSAVAAAAAAAGSNSSRPDPEGPFAHLPQTAAMQQPPMRRVRMLDGSTPRACVATIHPFRSVVKTHVMDGRPSVHEVNALIRQLEGPLYPWSQPRQRKRPRLLRLQPHVSAPKTLPLPPQQEQQAAELQHAQQPCMEQPCMEQSCIEQPAVQQETPQQEPQAKTPEQQQQQSAKQLD